MLRLLVFLTTNAIIRVYEREVMWRCLDAPQSADIAKANATIAASSLPYQLFGRCLPEVGIVGGGVAPFILETIGNEGNKS